MRRNNDRDYQYTMWRARTRAQIRIKCIEPKNHDDAFVRTVIDQLLSVFDRYRYAYETQKVQQKWSRSQLGQINGTVQFDAIYVFNSTEF